VVEEVEDGHERVRELGTGQRAAEDDGHRPRQVWERHLRAGVRRGWCVLRVPHQPAAPQDSPVLSDDNSMGATPCPWPELRALREGTARASSSSCAWRCWPARPPQPGPRREARPAAGSCPRRVRRCCPAHHCAREAHAPRAARVVRTVRCPCVHSDSKVANRNFRAWHALSIPHNHERML
jgi:hypothetical protein